MLLKYYEHSFYSILKLRVKNMDKQNPSKRKVNTNEVLNLLFIMLKNGQTYFKRSCGANTARFFKVCLAIFESIKN